MLQRPDRRRGASRQSPSLSRIIGSNENATRGLASPRPSRSRCRCRRARSRCCSRWRSRLGGGRVKHGQDSPNCDLDNLDTRARAQRRNEIDRKREGVNLTLSAYAYRGFRDFPFQRALLPTHARIGRDNLDNLDRWISPERAHLRGDPISLATAALLASSAFVRSANCARTCGATVHDRQTGVLSSGCSHPPAISGESR
jgi:hypothetical protein